MITKLKYVRIAGTTQVIVKTSIVTMKTATVTDYRLCMMTVAKILKKRRFDYD